MTADLPPDTAERLVVSDLRARVADAVQEHRDAEPRDWPDRTAAYRPGAPCGYCGEYPGPKHEASQCAHALATALLSVVAQLVADARADGAAEALVEMADAVRTTEVLFRRSDGSGVTFGGLLRERAAAIRQGRPS